MTNDSKTTSGKTMGYYRFTEVSGAPRGLKRSKYIYFFLILTGSKNFTSGPKSGPAICSANSRYQDIKPIIFRLKRLCFGKYQSMSPLKPNIIRENAVMSARIVPMLQPNQPVRWNTPNT